MFHFEKGIILLTFLWCLGLGALHIIPKWRNKWDTWIIKNDLAHISIAVFVFFLGLLNFFLLFFIK